MSQEQVVVRVPDGLTPAQVRRLGEDVEVLVQQGKSVVCQLEGSDLGVLDALARMQLLARRWQVPLPVRGAPRDLADYLGLSEVCRQPEAREEGVDVEEVVDVGDPSA